MPEFKKKKPIDFYVIILCFFFVFVTRGSVQISHKNFGFFKKNKNKKTFTTLSKFRNASIEGEYPLPPLPRLRIQTITVIRIYDNII